MNNLYFKILVIVVLFVAEGLSIYFEIRSARLFTTGNSFMKIFWLFFPILTLAGALLLVGYMLGIKAFNNIWIVSVVSITSILILEPLLAYTIFKQLPTRGAAIGFGLGILGFISTIFIR